MPDKIDIPMGGLGGLLILGGAAALTYYLWPKGAAGARSDGSSVPAGAGSSGGASYPSSSGSTSGTSYVEPGTSGAVPSTSDEQLGWEASPQGEASGAGSGPTWYTPGRQTGPSWYNGLGDLGAVADPRPVQYMALAEQVSRAQSLVDGAYSRWIAGPFARAVGATQSVADLVDSSRALAGGLIDALRALVADPDATYEDGSRRDAVVTSVAANYVGRVNSIVQTIGSQSAGAELLDFISRFPSSLQTVLSYTVDAAGNVVAGAAWGLSKTVVVLGLGVAAVAMLMRYSGVSIDAGPVKLTR